MKKEILIPVAVAVIVGLLTFAGTSYLAGSDAIDELRIRAIVAEEIAKEDLGKIGDLEIKAAADSTRDDGQQRDLDRIDRFIESL